MRLIAKLRFMLNHPLNRAHKAGALSRYLLWQTRCFFTRKPKVCRFGEKSSLIVKKGMTGATGNLYCGLHDFDTMGFLMHFLRKDDFFVDIGANIGSYTILASGEIGTGSFAFEPVPETFYYLKKNIQINSIEDKVQCFNIAVSDKEEIIRFTSDLDTCNHAMLLDNTNAIDVQSNTFDKLIKLNRPTLVKIDVEGFETRVINGMAAALESEYLKAIIIELNGSGGRYGFDEKEIHQKLLNKGFRPYAYNPLKRNLIKLNSNSNGNTIYIKDLLMVNYRINSSRQYRILKQKF